MTLLDLRNLVAALMGQPVDDTSRLTTARVDAAINNGYKQVAIDADCFLADVTLTAGPSVGLYVVPADTVGIAHVWHDGQLLAATMPQLLDGEEPEWRMDTATGAPRWWMRYSANLLRLYPKPAVGDVTANTFICPSSVEGGIALLVDTTDAPALPEPYHELLVYRAAFTLATDYFADDPVAMQGAQSAAATYTRKLNEFKSSMVPEGIW